MTLRSRDSSVKPLQKDVVLRGNDVFVALPTGFGVMAVYQVYYDNLNNVKGSSHQSTAVYHD